MSLFESKLFKNDDYYNKHPESRIIGEELRKMLTVLESFDTLDKFVEAVKNKKVNYPMYNIGETILDLISHLKNEQTQESLPIVDIMSKILSKSDWYFNARPFAFEDGKSYMHMDDLKNFEFNVVPEIPRYVYNFENTKVIDRDSEKEVIEEVKKESTESNNDLIEGTKLWDNFSKKLHNNLLKQIEDSKISGKVAGLLSSIGNVLKQSYDLKSETIQMSTNNRNIFDQSLTQLDALIDESDELTTTIIIEIADRVEKFSENCGE